MPKSFKDFVEGALGWIVIMFVAGLLAKAIAAGMGIR